MQTHCIYSNENYISFVVFFHPCRLLPFREGKKKKLRSDSDYLINSCDSRMFSLGNQSKLYPKSLPHVFHHITSLWGVSKHQMHSSALRVFDLSSVTLQNCEWENKEKAENKNVF